MYSIYGRLNSKFAQNNRHSKSFATHSGHYPQVKIGEGKNEKTAS
jgi:hypothetical protein